MEILYLVTATGLAPTHNHLIYRTYILYTINTRAFWIDILNVNLLVLFKGGWSLSQSWPSDSNIVTITNHDNAFVRSNIFILLLESPVPWFRVFFCVLQELDFWRSMPKTSTIMNINCLSFSKLIFKKKSFTKEG